jgi:hypothetical protein
LVLAFVVVEDGEFFFEAGVLFETLAGVAVFTFDDTELGFESRGLGRGLEVTL